MSNLAFYNLRKYIFEQKLKNATAQFYSIYITQRNKHLLNPAPVPVGLMVSINPGICRCQISRNSKAHDPHSGLM